jgi:hypothetical protein
MAELVIGAGGLVLSVTTFTEAVGLALVIGVAGITAAGIIYAFTRYSEVDVAIDLNLEDLVTTLS